jgi:hypothetical protein
MLWRRTTIAAVLLAIASGSADAAEPVRTLAWGILRIGTYFVNPPFVFNRRSRSCTMRAAGVRWPSPTSPD